MYRDIPASSEDVEERCVHSPLRDYALVDFGDGRKLERFGPYVVERPDAHALGKRALLDWQADWIYDAIGTGRWRAARADLPEAWSVQLDDQTVQCHLDARGRIGWRGVDLVGRRWITDRLRGCYDIDDPQVLNLFAGSGLTTHAAVQAGASVTHVDANADLLTLAQGNLGDHSARYVHQDSSAFVDGALMRGDRYDLIVVAPPRRGRGPGGKNWDIEVDLARLIKNLARLVSDRCLGIWIAVEGGFFSPPSLAQMLRDAFPGRAIKPGQLGVVLADGRKLDLGGAAYWNEEADLLARTERLRAAQIEDRLDVYLDAALGSRRTAAEPAQRLAELPRAQQEFVLRWVNVIARTNAEMGFQVAYYATEALQQLDEAGVEAWIFNAMDVFDEAGLHAGTAVMRDVAAYVAQQKDLSTGLAFTAVERVLEGFVHGLGGRNLRVAAADETYTDTETLHVPSLLNVYAERADNFRLFKAMAVHQWAQTWYGTWRESLPLACQEFRDPARATQVFHALETIRLDACIQRDLPGMYREMQALCALSNTPARPPAWQDAETKLRRPAVGVQDCYALLPALFDQELPAPLPYQGWLVADRVEAARALRIARDRDAFRIWLARVAEDERGTQHRDDAAAATGAEPQFELREIPDNDVPDGYRFELMLDGEPVTPPPDVQGTMASIVQDMGEIPEDYLTAAGEGAYAAAALPEAERDPAAVWQGTYHEEGAFHYNEWDYERQHYRKKWTVLRELEVHPRADRFVAETLGKYAGLVGCLRRTFEALRGEDKLLKRQVHGDDVDIDALVEAHADVSAGLEMTDRLFTKMRKLERDIAVMFMVDMSGSTKGWITDAERESLVLLCEALETLGDRYAIYGFSGMTRKRCEVYRVKRFDEPYDDDVRARISGITPQDYTRMGVTIRHLSRLLNEVDARTKLLITLSDGKPDDYDAYRGAYGIEDTRMALIEARRDGIHPFCITIDREARDYLPHMYGAVNYMVIDEVRKLPLKVSEIYRRLTT